MAVQAQYPSNVPLLNRNGQDSKNMLGLNNYTLLQPPSQPGAGGGAFLLDPSHLLPANGAGVHNHNHNNNSNPRKRAREVATTATAATTTTTTTAADKNNNYHVNPFNFSLQNHHYHHPQLIDLSQLQQQPNAVVSTGLKLSFGDQQIQQQRQQNHHHNGGGSGSNSNRPSLSSSVLISLFSDDIASQIKKHSDELNQFIHVQGEHLRRSIAEKRQRHYRALLGAAKEAVARRLKEKEAELEKACSRHAELEARAAQLGAESQVWQAKARAQEAQVASLQAQIQQAMMAGSGGGGGCVGAALKPPDREGLDSGAGGEGDAGAEDAESAYIDPDRVEVASLAKPAGRGGRVPRACRACRIRAATVVILPCRHLCVCMECDGVVQACPACLGLRNSSVEVYLT